MCSGMCATSRPAPERGTANRGGMPEAGTLTLADGARVAYRPIRPDDAPALQTFHRELSERTRYLRFLGIVPTLSDERARRCTDLDGIRRFALVAHPPAAPGELVAVARYEGLPDPRAAELAIVVADPWQHRGLGFALMQRLLAAARRRDIRVAHGVVTAENRPMLGLLRKLNLPQRTAIDRAILAIELDLSAG